MERVYSGPDMDEVMSNALSQGHIGGQQGALGAWSARQPVGLIWRSDVSAATSGPQPVDRRHGKSWEANDPARPLSLASFGFCPILGVSEYLRWPSTFQGWVLSIRSTTCRRCCAHQERESCKLGEGRAESIHSSTASAQVCCCLTNEANRRAHCRLSHLGLTRHLDTGSALN